MPLFSVMVPCFEQEEIVAECTLSLLNQDFNDVEFLISDDCSSDKTWDVINGFNDPRLIKIRQIANLGSSAHANELLALAKGDFLVHLAGDDGLFSSQALQTLQNHIF